MKTRLALALIVGLPLAPCGAQSLSLLGVQTAAPASSVTTAAATGDVFDGCGSEPHGFHLTARLAGEAGEGIFKAAAKVQELHNRDRPARALTSRERQALRPLFGDIVDEVQVTYDAKLIQQWSVLGHSFTLGQGAAAQTFGEHIYVARPDPKDAHTEGTLALLVHELTHVHQLKQRGSLSAFGEAYMRGWWQAGRSYHGNWMEKQAYCVEDQEGPAAFARYQQASSAD